MKPSRRTEESLIKRAKYGGRNVRALAIFVSFFAVLGFLALILAPASMMPGTGFKWFLVATSCIAVALWMLAIMTRQGEILGLTIVLISVAIHLLGIAALLLSGAIRDGYTLVALGWVVILLLIFMVLAINRGDLIELRRRGLSESVFGPGRPPRSLTAFGGIVLFATQMIVYALLLSPVIDAARTASECRDFLLMINVEEQALKQAMGKPVRPADKQFWATALDAAERLRDKAQQVKDQAAYGTRIRPIAAKYLRATERWRVGTADALAAGRMTRQARATLQEGDDLRDEAYAEFQRSFPGVGQRPK